MNEWFSYRFSRLCRFTTPKNLKTAIFRSFLYPVIDAHVHTGCCRSWFSFSGLHWAFCVQSRGGDGRHRWGQIQSACSSDQYVFLCVCFKSGTFLKGFLVFISTLTDHFIRYTLPVSCWDLLLPSELSWIVIDSTSCWDIPQILFHTVEQLVYPHRLSVVELYSISSCFTSSLFLPRNSTGGGVTVGPSSAL